MRTTLNSKQWAHLRGYVNTIDSEAKKKLLHRCENWEKSVAIELARVAAGKQPNDLNVKIKSLDSSLVAQVAEWLRK